MQLGSISELMKEEMVSWQWSVCHIALTRFEPRTAEFELQDFIVDVIVVEQHGMEPNVSRSHLIISD